VGTTTRLTSAVVAPLLERDDALVVLHSSLSEVRSGVGRMLLVSGEAGIGKTALVRSFTASVRGSARVLEGACDALAAPRPLGAFVDIGGGSGDRLRELVAQDPSPHEVFDALSEELAGQPSVLVVEDVHWADEATLDVLRVLGRRIEGVDALVILTYRDDAVGPVHPVRMLLGDLATAPALGRVALEPLSPQAVAEMAAGYALDAAELHRLTGGNPFYVHEVLEAGGDRVPATVGEVVYTRAARMSEDARSVLESVSVAPPALEPWALEAVCGAAAGALDECLAGGILVDDDGRARFRHELARMAIEAELGPSRRRGLHRALLSALGDPTRGIDPARLAHHAEGADDAAAVLHLAPVAARRAAAVGAHREAAAQYARALRFAAAQPAAGRAELETRLADALYATDDQVESIAARQRAIEHLRAAGDAAGEGDALCHLVTSYSCRGMMADARAAAEEALRVLEPLDPSPALGAAYDSLSLLALYRNDFDAAAEWGERAIECAGDDAVTLANALISTGTALLLRDGPDAVDVLMRGLEVAREHGLEQEIARAHNDVAIGAVLHRAHALADAHIEAGLGHCAEHDLDLWTLSMLGMKVRSELNQGRFDAASEIAIRLAGELRDSPAPRFEGLLVLATVRARRGDPGVRQALQQAAEIEFSPDELDWVGPLAIARAEAAWLAGDEEHIDELTSGAFALARDGHVPWMLGELACWRRRAGIDESIANPVAEPWALELDGRHEDAAAAWHRLGCPYEAAVAMGLGCDGLEDAHRRLQELGAGGAAAVYARRLRRRGVRGIARGPRPSTRENPANLTGRELEVLALVAGGLSNAEIALRLHVSTRTVDHHVSNILRKLEVPSRARASIAAARLGIVPVTS
jgi:DNA-binding CsgD family transcriptional regulator/tetratricopeptide (TPR) repeat protein